jgi:hypothetical protein
MPIGQGVKLIGRAH